MPAVGRCGGGVAVVWDGTPIRTEPYWFCDQYTNDTVQSPSMQQWDCSLHGANPQRDAVYTWPSCGGGCVQV